MPVNPVVAEMLKQMAEAGAPPLTELSPAEGRAMYLAMNEANTKAEIYSVTDRSIPVSGSEIGIRIYKCDDRKGQPCLVYFHGGGWVIGDLDTHDAICRQLALQADCVVIAVDYRLAPENPFPTPFNDCYEALLWIRTHADELGIDNKNIAVGGDSAGGNLSTCVSLRVRDEGIHLIHQLLIYPVTGLNFETSSYIENAEGYMLTMDSMKWFWAHYLQGSEESARNPFAVPMKAENLSDLPPATVITAEFDPLRDEGEEWARRLEAAGVKTTVKRFDGMIHGFFSMSDYLEEARVAITLAATELRKSFSKMPG